MTQANSTEHLTYVHFEPEDSVEMKILGTLKDAASKIDVTKDKLTFDAIYAGDLLKWKKLANTLRLRLALQCTRNLGSIATAIISEVMADEANTIGAATDAFKMTYENINNNENPFWRSQIKNNPANLPKLNDFLLAFFRSYKDPRLAAWYDPVLPVTARDRISDTLSSTADDSLRVVSYPIPYNGIPKVTGTVTGWNLAVPAPQGAPTTQTYSLYSNISTKIFGASLALSTPFNITRPVMLLGVAESNFLKAEARILGLGGSKTAEQYYNDGIDANFAFWNSADGGLAGITNVDRDAYKLVSGIKFGTSGAGFKNYLGITNTNIPLADINKIWVQQWLNYWPDQSFDFWNLERRTQLWLFPPHTNPGNASFGAYMDMPQRTSYPNDLISFNPQGYAEGLATLSASSFSDEQNKWQLQLHFAKPFTPINWPAVAAGYDLSYLRKWYGNTIQQLQAAAASGGFTFTITSTFHP